MQFARENVVVAGFPAFLPDREAGWKACCYHRDSLPKFVRPNPFSGLSLQRKGITLSWQ